MNAVAFKAEGLDRNPVQFLDLLVDRKALIAQHALAAWDGETLDDITNNLQAARKILQQISGTAAKVGYPELGVTAQHCEAQITAHLEGDYADLAICPGEIIWFIDTFVEASDSIIV